jgi:hypothetical protein
MPIVFKERWNCLQPVHLTRDGTKIALLWKAKARMKVAGPVRLKELAGMEARATARKLTRDEMKEIKTSPIAGQKKVIENALSRDKVTLAMAKKYSGLDMALFAKDKDDRDAVLEEIHNDRLRIADRGMLGLWANNDNAIRNALVAAKPKFTADPYVAELLARAVAIDGTAVTVTQGVHQKGDPHFDVRLVDDDPVFHINVTSVGRLTITSISYLNKPPKTRGLTMVSPDASIAPVVGGV